MRVYSVHDETAGRPPVTREFTNYRAAGRYFRRLARDGAYVHASTWRPYYGGRERLDPSGAIPAWAWDPRFKMD